MQERDLSLSIAHLYPKLLNLYGDMGNIITLKNRCEWRGISVSVSQINIGDDVSGYDLYFIGGGQDKQQEEVASELYSNKDKLTIERDKGAVFLGICGGYQLFGHY
jgi:CobQ-like glutamine amidotransferase family enzyme